LSTAELQARNEDLDAFASTVAHDLRYPLGLMLGHADFLVEDYADLAEAELLKSLQTISTNAHKMSNIVQELLLLASVRSSEVVRAPLDMSRIVAEAQVRLNDMIDEYEAEVAFPDAWPQAMGYGPWVEQVWVNYLSNAIKYGGQPPRIVLGFDAGTIPAGNQGDELGRKMIRFWVRDNGPGLTEEEQAQLFAPFTRLDQARVQGHGLGLSIVRRIVEKLGGQVRVESDGVPGHGSVFSFTLPASTG
jgi:signal transduction histidine kinase